MPDRSTNNQAVQVRKESVYGTDPTTGTKKMSAFGIDLDPAGNFPAPFFPQGNKYPTLDPIGKEFSTSKVTGRGTYTELIYPLSMIANTAVSTAITLLPAVTGTLAREWIFGSNVAGNDTITSYTAEQGDANFGELVTGMQLTGFSIDIDRDGVTLGGDGIARQVTAGITIAGSPTLIPLVPVLGQSWDVYKDVSAAALGTTKLTRTFKVTWGLSGRFNGLWPLDSTLPSFAALIEPRPDSTFSVEMEADAVGVAAMLTIMRADTAMFWRCLARSAAIIESTTKYGLQIDVCAKVTGMPNFGDREGVKTCTWSMKAFADTTWNKAWEVRVVNNLTAL